MVAQIETVTDEGKGKTFIVLQDSSFKNYDSRNNSFSQSSSTYLAPAEKVVTALLSPNTFQDSEGENSSLKKLRVVSLLMPEIRDTNWQELASNLVEYLDQKKIRQASFVCFGATCTVAQYFTLLQPKRVRTLTLVDASTRPHPNYFERFFDAAEKYLPLGLPFRLQQRGFYASSFLQRLRCPVMIVTSPHASAYLIEQAEYFNKHLPTAWKRSLTEQCDWADLSRDIIAFQNVPAKCPQKNMNQETGTRNSVAGASG